MFGRANHPWIDETRAPLYVVAPPDCSDAEVNLLFRACDTIYADLTHDVAWVIDSTDARNVSAKMRRIVADHLRRNRLVMMTYVAGIAIVVPNAVMRGVFTAITWLVPLEFPHEVVQTRAQGLHWAEQALRERQRLRLLVVPAPRAQPPAIKP